MRHTLLLAALLGVFFLPLPPAQAEDPDMTPAALTAPGAAAAVATPAETPAEAAEPVSRKPAPAAPVPAAHPAPATTAQPDAKNRKETTAHAPDPGLAAALAFFPGVAVHGAGHYYAGQPVAGTLLLLAEAGALYMAYRGTADILANTGRLDTRDEHFGETGPLSLGIGLAAGGLAIFFTTWLYDLNGAPLAAEAYSRNHALQPPEKRASSLEPVMLAGGAGLAWTLSY